MSKLTASELNKQQFIKICEEKGISKVEIEYDGFGDSGQINEVTIFNKTADPDKYSPNSIIEIKEPVQYYRAEYVQGIRWADREENLRFEEGSFQDMMEEIVYSILEARWPGWEINEGSYGCITLNADGTGKYLHTVKIEETSQGELE
jgi:hypothetical protein